MNTSSRLAIASIILGLSSLSSLAQAEETTVLEPVKLQKQTPVSHAGMNLLSGTYLMEDGRDLRVNGHGLRLRISLGDEAAVAMTPSADGIWHSADGEMSMRFHGEHLGRPDTVVLTVPRKNWSLSSLSRR